MKRLLCIVSSLDVGGAETMMMKIFRSLPEQYKIDFIVSASTGFYEDEVQHLGGKIYRVPLRTKHPLKTFIEIKHIVKNNYYKSVLKLCDTPKGYLDLLAAKHGGAVNLCVRSCNASANMGFFSKMMCNVLRSKFNKIANVKLAPSELAAIFTFGKKEVECKEVKLLHNAIDLNVYKYSLCKRDAIRNEFNIDEKQIVIGHIGRFSKQKNHKFIIEIFEEIVKKNANVILLLVGEGELKEEIQTHIIKQNLSDKVIFTGIRSDIPKILSAMDVFLFPSLYEGMPNTVIEAQAVGLPCVISDTITDEAKITNLVKYMSLERPAKDWADVCLNTQVGNRLEYGNELKKYGYDILDVSKEFIQYVFE